MRQRCWQSTQSVHEMRDMSEGGNGVPNTDAVLYEPLVDCFGGMRHEYSASKIRFGKHIWEGGGVVNVEAVKLLD